MRKSKSASNENAIYKWQDLLAKLVHDCWTENYIEERNILRCSKSALMWNLFNGNYKFSSSQLSAIIKHIDELNLKP